MYKLRPIKTQFILVSEQFEDSLEESRRIFMAVLPVLDVITSSGHLFARENGFYVFSGSFWWCGSSMIVSDGLD